MTELDDLRAALHEPPDFAPRPLDLVAVMSTGGRIRRRRRLAAGAASGLTVLALLAGGGALAQQMQPAAVRPAAPPAASQQAAIPDVIRTGLTAADGGEWVLYVKPVDGVPQVTFGLMLGVRTGNGEPVDEVMANETEGSESAPGFHAVQGGMVTDQGRTPTFGYYVGPASSITATVGGEKVNAHQAPLMDGIQAFWLDATDVTDLTAYDQSGRRLPAGNPKPGVG